MTQREALEILKTGANVFLTGEPGSGKTYTINQYVQYLREHGIEPAITASTGIAATHIGGQTIHSWSGIGIKKNLSKYEYEAITEKEHVVKRVDKTKVLIIDEVSMLDASVLESVDMVCRMIKHTTLPFGGMQVILVGDFFQLPPVNKEQEGSQFAFYSESWKEMNPIICYITEQHRQEDDTLLSILSSIRSNSFGPGHAAHMHIAERVGILEEDGAEGMPRLFSHNEDVDRINKMELGKVEGLVKIFTMDSSGASALVEALKRGCLSPERLELKTGAKVMFTKNNVNEGYVNGTLGEVEDFDEDNLNPIVRLRNGKLVEVQKAEWVVEENNKIKARIMQYPLRLAWAITIHKSQGMSLDAAIMDLSQVFEYGQGYVALSRVRSLSGIFLLGVNDRAFQVHPEVLAQDMSFRTSSEEATQVFDSMEKEELQKMHENFIIASGGILEKKKKATGALEKIRAKNPKAYMKWTEEEEAVLREKFQQTNNLKTIAKQMGRQVGGIKSRLIKLGLIEEES
jgi:ATP-dependent DNA helicase PIF1